MAVQLGDIYVTDNGLEVTIDSINRLRRITRGCIGERPPTISETAFTAKVYEDGDVIGAYTQRGTSAQKDSFITWLIEQHGEKHGFSSLSPASTS